MRDYSRTRALYEANKLFKPVATRNVTDDYDRAQQSLRDNRERLKAERLARDVKSTTDPEKPPRASPPARR
jgi:hypothetical protein